MVSLQGTDREIAKIDELLERLPSEIENFAASLNTAKAEYEEYKKKLEDARKLRQQKEKDVEATEEAIRKANAKLHEIKTNQEYTAAIKETDNMKTAISKLEDEQLEIMENLEKSMKDEGEYKEKVAKEEKEFALIKAEKEAEIDTIKAEKESLVVFRNETVSLLEKSYLDKYEKLATARDGIAISKLKEGYCEECHTTVRKQMAVEIRVGEKVHHCPQCTRFLYSPATEKV